MLSIFPVVVIVLTSPSWLPAQNLGVVGHRITDNPPVAATDVTKEVTRQKRADLKPISVDAEDAIRMVEDLLAPDGINLSGQLPDPNFETSSEAPVSNEPVLKNEYLSDGLKGNECQGNCQSASSKNVALTHGPTAMPQANKDHPDSLNLSNFSYEHVNPGKDRWYANFQVSTGVNLTGFRIEIVLDKPAHLLGVIISQDEVSSTDNIHFIIINSKKMVVPGSPYNVRFFVKYSVEEVNLPRVKNITQDGRLIYSAETESTPSLPEPPAMASPTPISEPVTVGPTATTQKKFARLIETNITTQEPFTDKEHVTTMRDVFTARPLHTPRPPVTKQNGGSTEIVDGVQCGQVEVQPSPFIVYGQYTARGQWPWHAALYKSKGTDLTYMCGGTLIGKKTILTAAHCVGRPYNNRRVDPETLVVYLGKHNLNLWSEGGVQTKQVHEIYVHPDYNSTDFHADIAVLELINPVEFSLYIKPVCLWDRNQIELSEVEGLEGVVVGWHFDEKGLISEELMMDKMHVLPQQTCYQQFSHYISNETYCATFRNGASVCNGDSGGGMVFPKRNRPGSPETWVLRGLVSFGTLLEGRRICSEKYFVVFTDVAKYLDWIQKYQ